MIEKMCKNCGRSYQQYNSLQSMCGLCTYNKYHKPNKPLKVRGKKFKAWEKYRMDWFKDNPPTHAGYYNCGICYKPVHIDETTLDHIQPRSSQPNLTLEKTNIQPTHWKCNSEKGSKH